VVWERAPERVVVVAPERAVVVVPAAVDWALGVQEQVEAQEVAVEKAVAAAVRAAEQRKRPENGEQHPQCCVTP
jgi:hypothetical protein